MAAIQNLEVVVDIDIGRAIANLTKLQEELLDVAEMIEAVDAIGTEGINIRTEVDDLDFELAKLAAEIEAFERTQRINIGTRVGGLGGADAASLAVMHQMAGGGFGGGGFSEAEGPLDRFNIRMSDLHNLLASLIPILVVFIGALPAAITALITLAGAALAAAGAFAAITGFGALGAAMGRSNEMPALEDFTELLSEIVDDFFEAFAPLAQRLDHVFMAALDGLERFFEVVAAEGDALVSLTDEARDFGRFLIEFTPALLRNLAGLVEALAPVFSGMADFIRETDIIEGFLMETLKMLPALVELTMLIVAAIPRIIEMSIAFLRVTVIIAELIGTFWWFITVGGLLTDQTVGAIIGSLLALVSVLALSIKAFNLFSGTAVVGAIKTLAVYTEAAIVTVLANLGLMSSINMVSRALALLITTATIMLGIGLLAWVTQQTIQFSSLADNIRESTSAMKEFNRVSGRTGGGGFGNNSNPYRGSSGRGGSGGDVSVNMERSGNRNEDKSDANKAGWHVGRMTGKRP